MVGDGDAVGNGLVASLARPGANITGTSFLTSAMIGKQLGGILPKPGAFSANDQAILTAADGMIGQALA